MGTQELVQLLANGVVAASVFALVGVSFSFIYSTVRFFHFAHGVVFALGPYFVLVFSSWLGLSLSVSVSLSIICCAISGSLIELLVYRPLRLRRASSLIFLLSSLGIYIIILNMISLFFGDDSKSIRMGTIAEGLNILGARVTRLQILTVAVSIALLGLSALVTGKTRMGKAMRAVANNVELADLSGINADRIVLFTFILGSAMASVGGILAGFDVDLNPGMGMKALMMGVSAVIIGGVRSILGITFGALLLGMARHLGVWYIGSQWQDAIAFFVLLVFLLLRPQGFLGKKTGTA